MSSSDPKVSVITTVYNCEKFVKESLDSVFAQNYRNFELILVNDGSSDATRSILEPFLEKYGDFIVFLDFNENKRIPTRRNEAIEQAKGDYISIHDGDDISLPNRLEKQVKFLDEHPDIFCVGSWAERIDEDNKDIGVMQYPPSTHEEIVSIITSNRTFYLNPIIDPTTMFRHDEFIKLGMYTLRDDIYTVPDYDLWLRAIVYGRKFANLQENLIKYRVNSQSMTESKKKIMIQHHMTVWREFMRALDAQTYN
jgi:glycosyltransferase involved in cell wall biosynthesis